MPMIRLLLLLPAFLPLCSCQTGKSEVGGSKPIPVIDIDKEYREGRISETEYRKIVAAFEENLRNATKTSKLTANRSKPVITDEFGGVLIDTPVTDEFGGILVSDSRVVNSKVQTERRPRSPAVATRSAQPSFWSRMFGGRTSEERLKAEMVARHNARLGYPTTSPAFPGIGSGDRSALLAYLSRSTDSNAQTSVRSPSYLSTPTPRTAPLYTESSVDDTVPTSTRKPIFFTQRPVVEERRVNYYSSNGLMGQQIGNNYHRADGVMIQKVGDNYHSSDGLMIQKVGDQYLRSDGLRIQKVGDHYMRSDGVTIQKVGNNYHTSDGRMIQTMGAP